MKNNIRLLAYFNFFTDLKFHSAVLILYFAKVTGSYTLAMSLFSIATVSSAVFEVPTGIFSDFIGRKKTLILGAISASVSAILYAISSSFSVLIVGAIFDGISRSWYSGNNDALLHDSLKETDSHHLFAEYLGKTSAFFQLALTVGAVLGSIIANWSFSLIMWFSVLPQFICLLLAFFIKESKASPQESSNIFSHLHLASLRILNNKRLRLLTFRSVLVEGVSEANFQFRAAFINTLWPVWAIGLSKAISYMGASLSFWFSGKLIKKFGIYKILIIWNIYSRIVNFFSLLIPNVTSPFFMATTSIFYGAGTISDKTLRQWEYSENQRATMDSLNTLLGNLFFAVFSIILGFLADSFGPAKALLFSQLILFTDIFIVKKLSLVKA